MDVRMETEEEVICTYLPGYDSVKSYSQDTFKAIIGATKAASSLPDGGREYTYYQSFPDFCELMKEEGKIILSAMSCLAKSQGIRKSFDDLNPEEAFELLCGVNETILENADLALDNASGTKPKEQLPEDLVVASVRAPMPINTSWNKVQTPSGQSQTIRLLSAKNIQRPQMRFKEKTDNRNCPFIPILKWKPNSIKPMAILPEIIDGKEEYGNPYEWEIEKFQPTEEMLEPVEPIVPPPVEETSFVYIETESQLQEMLEDLSQQKEIAIDLEHHSYRSFQGIVCLMQISTRTTDYIVDTLRLRTELQDLNDVFTSPKIVKVLHGADMDIPWLQRDFGLYVVNMFDTGQAARVLSFAHFSLAYMLKHYCKVDANKAFQLADWRIRPLPAEMIKYAREDTHYLLYIYDCMKNDLLQKGNEVKNLLVSTFQRSKLICLKVYEKPAFHEESYLELYKKSKKVFTSRQLYALKELYSWRDHYAREEDESTGYVLPNHMLLQIAEILPREQQGILACCNPVPPVVRQQLNELHSIILKARESSVLQLTEETENKPKPSEINIEVDLESVLHCPHDIHHHHEETLHLATLFGEDATVENPSSDDSLLKKTKLSLPLLLRKKTKVKSKDGVAKYEKAVEALKSYFSPFERYKLVKDHYVVRMMGGEGDSLSESDRVHRIHDHLKRMAAIGDPDGDDDAIGKLQVPLQKPSTTPTVSSNINSPKKSDATPLRKKEKKHKRKHGDDPEQAETAPTTPSRVIGDAPPAKKSKTPEKQKDHKPFNYLKSPSSSTSERGNVKPLKKVFNPDSDEEEYKKPSKLGKKKKKHSKQASFSGSGKHHATKNWLM